jgi:hypothetical protein
MGSRPAGRPWTRIEDKQLRDMVTAGKKAPEIAQKLKRTISVIYARKKYLNNKSGIYIDIKGNPISPSEQRRLEAEEKTRSHLKARKDRLNSARLERIAQFEQQQLSSRDWISFAEIIDWRSRDRADGSLSEEKRCAALNDLSAEISAGNVFFGDKNKSLILLTSPLYRVSRTLLSDPWALRVEAWLTKEQWGFWRGGPARDQILTWCWIPRTACLRWATNVPFEPKPEWVERLVLSAPAADISTAASGKPKKLVGNEIAAEFERWRTIENKDKPLPTFEEDWAHMALRGVTKQKVVDLRKGYPTRRRGEKKR